MPDGKRHGFLLRKGEITTIDFPDATLTAAIGINARGDVVGRYQTGAGSDHGYLLNKR